MLHHKPAWLGLVSAAAVRVHPQLRSVNRRFQTLSSLRRRFSGLPASKDLSQVTRALPASEVLEVRDKPGDQTSRTVSCVDAERGARHRTSCAPYGTTNPPSTGNV